MTADNPGMFQAMNGQQRIQPAQIKDGGWHWPAVIAGTVRHVYAHTADLECASE